ncbi:hypothetical protein HanRHA438_Chr02g0062251 [Helianthus annuus]|nr:hypothetical protein HanRHA438_Chr02g0062251 [Helianthus annuus]
MLIAIQSIQDCRFSAQFQAQQDISFFEILTSTTTSYRVNEPIEGRLETLEVMGSKESQLI